MNAAIKSYLDAGLSVVPVGKDKRPIISTWQTFQAAPAMYCEAEFWKPPFAIIAGRVSGGVICIDFDDKGSVFRDWGTALKLLDPAIAAAMTVQRTPSGGYHCVFKSKYQIRNKKLAMKNGPVNPETGKPKPIILIETRGEGGYFLASPSPGYVLKRGSFENLKELSIAQTEFLLKHCESFNQVKKPEPQKHQRSSSSASTAAGETPFDLYDMGNDPVDLLLHHGWTIKYQRNGTIGFLRPGKKPGDAGTSATWNHIPGRFYCFTSSTAFEAEQCYKASAVYAVLEHNGNWSAAARALRDAGYHV